MTIPGVKCRTSDYFLHTRLSFLCFGLPLLRKHLRITPSTPEVRLRRADDSKRPVYDDPCSSVCAKILQAERWQFWFWLVIVL